MLPKQPCREIRYRINACAHQIFVNSVDFFGSSLSAKNNRALVITLRAGNIAISAINAPGCKMVKQEMERTKPVKIII